ncbi:SDR family NAD(P)-dependent oxidoreductase [Streptomyces sp. CoH27]|uniref:SDR family NAD(P)-dependent oxidoreductase n=1 Tax=Streptomyces sp. CoH27 TaxID=2875763 RepID=UPI001CD3021B|nr:SDR family NAD(P)-dependent oxidoreductase [Streptomyces sp. CoH27]
MNPVAVLVGTAEGTGPAAAVRLAESGLDIALVDPGPASADETLRRLTAVGRRCTAIEADPADTEAFSAALARIRSDLGRPGMLLTCIGTGPDEEDDSQGADVTAGAARYAPVRRALRTLFVTNRAAAGEMLRGGGGRIVNVARAPRTERTAGDTGRTLVAGLAGFTASVAPELAPFGISVHFVAPAALRPGTRPPVGTAPPADPGSYPEHLADQAALLTGAPAAALTGQGVYLPGRPLARHPAPTPTPTSRGTVATP